MHAEQCPWRGSRCRFPGPAPRRAGRITTGGLDDWQFNHFSHGPQGCPGVALALLVGRTMLATLLGERDAKLLAPSLDPAKPLPHSLDYFSLRFSLSN